MGSQISLHPPSNHNEGGSSTTLQWAKTRKLNVIKIHEKKKKSDNIQN